MNFEWKKEYLFGEERIDSQHQQLVKLINDFGAAVNSGLSQAVLEKTLLDLLKYAKKHFLTEQQYFDQIEYTGKDRHKAEHLDFTRRAIVMYQTYAKGQGLMARDVQVFLVEWLQNHFLKTDLAFATALRKHLPEQPLVVTVPNDDDIYIEVD